ncbi:MAG TPA: hypothetical protein VMV46_13130 [Thermoanaerobaculia bacterium]|nr:hypothetical protein [Thermoanaerobaculia bacterium]
MLSRTELRIWLWAGLITVAGFLIDLRGSTGVAVVICYVAALVVALRLPRRVHVLAVAGACSLFTLVVGLLRTPDVPLAGWAIRGLVLFALWVVALAAPLAAPEEPSLGLARARASGGIDPRTGLAAEDWLEEIAEDGLALLRAKPQYQRVRWIDAGEALRERIRVERAAGATACSRSSWPRSARRC